MNESPETAADPLGSVYGWSPEGVVCECCGEPTDRWWRDEGVVCPACKVWSDPADGVQPPE
ncbi:DUF7573 domain-containing protein [Halalkalicoccus jeotgali]|uniref:DUF7573 domain-containing protein n=1 Tax=Halalkalicoccus jeotgali TaxID=413810 RepID=UPI0011D289A9|nr:hypothetical protein [Halalkalicoccus jeotgali]